MKQKAILVALTFLMLLRYGLAEEFHVAPEGAPGAPGTQSRPFGSLTAARDAIRALKARSGLPKEGIIVWVHGGDYFMNESLALDAKDSGQRGAGVVYIAVQRQTPRLIGGVRLQADWFSPVTEQSPVWARLDPAAQGHVLQADLKAHGITDYGKLVPRGMGRPGIAALELFLDAQPMPLAHWPNEGFERIAATPQGMDASVFTYSGDRPARWTKAADPWIFGYLRETWADSYCPVAKIDLTSKTITLGTKPNYGVKKKLPWRALNLLEEIDQPGEWYLDRASGILYFWPPAPLAGKTLLASVLETPLIKIDRAAFVTFRGLTLEACRGEGISVRDGDSVRIERCTVRNTGTRAISISGGNQCGVDRCEMSGNGSGGVAISGGNRATLTPCGHSVTNCRIHDYSRWNRTYVPAIGIQGVGCRAAHNLIYDAPHFAISYGGNEHLIEYNDIHDVGRETDDASAIYTGRDWAVRGNIIRYNFIHDVKSILPSGNGVHGVYLDDAASGNTVYRNIFYKIQNCGVFVGGGRDNIVEHNVFVQCSRAAFHIDDRYKWFHEMPGDSWNLREKIMKLRYDQPPWSTKYPKLAAILKDGYDVAKHPGGDRLAGNIGFKNKAWIHESPKGTAAQYVEQQDNLTDQDPLFVDEEQGNLALRPDSPALKLPGFRPIPFEKIGIEK